MNDETSPRRREDETLPDIPLDVRDAARVAPDHWLGMIDPAWRAEGPPPHWALMGEYRSSPEGRVVEWRDNEDYRPSPALLGLPGPTDPVDEAVQLAATGYGSEEEVVRLLAGSEVSVLLAPDGRPLTARSPEGSAVIPVFTSADHLRATGQLASRVITVADLAGQLPEGHRLYINPTGPVTMMVDNDLLLAAVDATTAPTEPAPPGGPVHPGAVMSTAPRTLSPP